MIHYDVCPVCRHNDFTQTVQAKDYTVSGSLFNIYHCNKCSFRFTQDVPDQYHIGAYYQSEDYVSHSDTQKGIVNYLYHKVRTITLKSKAGLVKKYSGVSNGNILDVGCGTGAFLNAMKRKGWSVEGLEPDPKAAELSEKLYGISTQHPEYLFRKEAGSYNAITMWHVLEHVHQLHHYIAELKMLIKDGGVIIIAVPNYTSYDAQHYKMHWAAYDVPRHLYHFSPASMQTLVQQYGLKIKAIKPMWFDSFYVSMLSEKYKTGKVRLFQAFAIGLMSNFAALFNKKKCSSVIYVIGE
jgi:2-polyprenyl-3-methyl-5-hydroxy-6-metoxy-1,4-benzoquinol methylase